MAIRRTGFDKGPYTQFDSRPLAWAFATTETGGPVTQATIPPGVRRRVEVMRVGPPPSVWGYVAGPERLRETRENFKDPKYAETHVYPLVFAGVGVFNVPPVTEASFEYAQKRWTSYELEFVVSARDVDAEAYS